MAVFSSSFLSVFVLFFQVFKDVRYSINNVYLATLIILFVFTEHGILLLANLHTLQTSKKVRLYS